MEVRITKLHPSSKIVTGGTNSGVDLFAHLDAPVLLCPGMRKLIPTGIAVHLPTHLEAHLRPKRSLAIEYGVTMLDAPQIIRVEDNAEIQVLLINLGRNGFSVKPGMAIAEMAIAPVYPVNLRIASSGVSELDELPEMLRHSAHFAEANLGVEVLTVG